MSDVNTRIRKLLSLAGNNPNEHEAESAMRAALKLAAKHNVDLSALNQESTVGEALFESHGRPWERLVAQSVAKLYFCEYLYIRLGKKRCRHIFVGTQENSTIAQEITDWVSMAVSREGRKGGSTPFYNSFCSGASFRISARVQAMLADAKASTVEGESSGKSLVLASVYEQRQAENQDYLGKVYPKLKTKALRVAGSDTAGFAAGGAYGDTVGLHRQVGAAPRTARLARS